MTTLPIVRGDSFGTLLRLWEDPDKTQPADLTGATVRAQVRSSTTSEDAIDFDVLVTGNEVKLTLLPSQTRTLPRRGVWDCEVDWSSDGTSIKTVVGGDVCVTEDVTR